MFHRANSIDGITPFAVDYFDFITLLSHALHGSTPCLTAIRLLVRYCITRICYVYVSIQSHFHTAYCAALLSSPRGRATIYAWVKPSLYCFRQCLAGARGIEP